MTDPADCNLHEFESDESTTCIHCGASFEIIPRKPGYRERCEIQLANWVAGTSRHNTIDDECCPDFSCCTRQGTPKADRERFAKLEGREREEMLMTFFSRWIERMGLGGKVHIAGRE